ncbi:MAG: ribonuclease E/G [Robiginitomaculum sp.]|nr:MAG: ribonuclease E/G [Robiginitomaculum sp.]
MSKKMLIDASHPEETRVVVVDGTRVEELDYESENKRQLRGNVYLARVTRVEPSLQAAFVEYGGNRHGFLAFSEIHPDYYQIPHEDRIALLESEQAESLQEDEEEETEIAKKGKGTKKDTSDDDDNSDVSDEDSADGEDADAEPDTENGDTPDASDDEDDSDDDDVADASDKEAEDEQKKMHGARRKRQSRRRYKIQEVIKRGQILLIQAVKEERGNKGAAMTTYLSLAGRYCVLMPNTPRGGGISRKIANGADRKRLKAVMSEMSVPKGMGVIVRTAGAKRTKVEIKRDYDYLSRLWDTIRDTTLKSIAPALIHEEGNLVKRSIRDLYGKDIDSILVQGDEAYRMAKDFIKMLMPSHAKNVQPYKDDIPLFLRYQVEQQIEACLEPVAQLKSGGYLVIHPTEALVSVDVNSGRSTKERNVERTALKTNLETADELARQMRLRDLAGLIVVDFIDMDENRNNRAVEKRMRDALSKDRARVQMSKISQFGLMEISRQRRRRSLLEGSTASCEHCYGVGRKRSVESSALKAIRAVEEEGIRGRSSRIRLTVTPDVASYLFNEKRELLNTIETNSQMFTEIVGDASFIRPKFEIERVAAKSGRNNDPLEEVIKENRKTNSANKHQKHQRKDRDGDEETETSPQTNDHTANDDENRPKRKRRRGRRGGRGRRNNEAKQNPENAENSQTVDTAENTEAQAPDAKVASEEQNKAKPSRARRKPKAQEAETPASDHASEDTSKDASKDTGPSDDKTSEAKPKRARRSRKKVDTGAIEAKTDDTPETAPAEKPKRKRAPAKKAASKKAVTEDAPKSEKTSKPEEAPKAKGTAKKKAAPKKTAKKPAEDTEKPKAEKPEVTEKPARAASAKPKPKAETASDAEDDAAKAKRRSWWKKRNPFG